MSIRQNREAEFNSKLHNLRMDIYAVGQSIQSLVDRMEGNNVDLAERERILLNIKHNCNRGIELIELHDRLWYHEN